ncbi:TonB-dependent receptor [bacterium]|nr:TonB-dependent receptor [bacterium]
MKYLLLFTVLSFVAPAAMGQTLTIIDEETGNPVVGVAATSRDPVARARSDVHGQLDLSRFRGSKAITFRRLGYQAVERSYASFGAEPTLNMRETLFHTDEVVVSATRWRQTKREVPERTVTIYPRDMYLENPQTAADLLTLSGEVYVQKSQMGGGSPMLRGFATNRVLITVDGVRMNTAIFRSGNLQNVISLDPNAIERTEVLFGPGSVMYGSDAIGGVMSFTTREARYADNGSMLLAGHAMLRGSSANAEKTGHVDVNLGWHNLALLTSVSYADYGDLRMGSDGPDEYLRTRYVEQGPAGDMLVANDDPELQVPTGYGQLNFMQKVHIRPSTDWDLSYGLQYSRSTDYARYDRLQRPKGDGLRSAEWYYGPQRWTMHSLHVLHNAATAAYDHLRITLAGQFFEESRHDRDFGKVTLYNRTEQVDAWSANVDAELALTTRQRLSYGVEAIYNEVHSSGTDLDISTGETIPGASRYPDGSTWSSLGAYAHYRNTLSDALTLQAGLRYSAVALDATFDNAFYDFPFSALRMRNNALNGSLGAVFAVSTSTLLSTQVSTGFRAPNVDDAAKVFDSSPGSVVIPNPDLGPEYATSVEASIDQQVDGILRLQLTGYYTWLRDALVRRNSTLNEQDSIMYDGTLSQVQSVQNAAEAWVEGIQASVEVHFGKGLRLLSHFNWQEGEEQLDDGSTAPLRHAAPWFGTTTLSYRLRSLELALSIQYNGEVAYEDLGTHVVSGTEYLYATDGEGRPYSPSWTIINLKAQYRLTDLVTLHAGVENIADLRYRPYSSGISAPGRNFIGSVTLDF